MIKAIIFDYGGTLDSRGDHWSEVIYRAYRTHLPHIARNDFRRAYVIAERALDGSGLISPADTFLDVMLRKIALQFTHLGLNDSALLKIATDCYESARECIREARPVLEALASRYPLAIVSNFYGNLPAVLADFGIAHLFRAVIDSTTVGIRKPDPAIFRLGIRALNTSRTHISLSGDPHTHILHTHPTETPPSEILVVGDSISKDILPATSLGCPTAHLPGIPWDPTTPSIPLPPTTIPLTTLSDLIFLIPE